MEHDDLDIGVHRHRSAGQKELRFVILRALRGESEFEKVILDRINGICRDRHHPHHHFDRNPEKIKVGELKVYGTLS